jgi:homocysteine S-methyltransferase
MQFKKGKIYYLAGATGTEIFRRGFPTGLPLWSARVLFERPELLKQIYLDYIKAGADIITTNTFRTQRRTLAKAGLAHETERINRLAVEIAVAARKESQATRPILIAGSITTLEDCYRPDLIPPLCELEKEHQEQAELLADTPIDFFLLETFNSIREAVVAARAAAATGKPLAVSFTANADGDILNGDHWDEAVKQLSTYNPIALLVNCVSEAVATKSLEKIKDIAISLPFGAYANGAGKADDENGWKFTTADRIDAYLHSCSRWIDLGATIIGGCCGTNPEYTRAYSQLKRC